MHRAVPYVLASSAIGLTSLTVGCAGPSSLMEQTVAATDVRAVEVRGRTMMSGLIVNESFELGNGRVPWVQRKGHRSSNGVAQPVRGGFRFRFDGHGTTYFGDCDVVEEASGRRSFACSCAGGGQRVEVEATDRQCGRDIRTFAGQVRWGDEVHELRSIGRPRAWSQLHEGFTVGSAPVMAVELNGPGRVWLASEVAPHHEDRLSCVATALLLYRPLLAYPVPLGAPSCSPERTVPTSGPPAAGSSRGVHDLDRGAGPSLAPPSKGALEPRSSIALASRTAVSSRRSPEPCAWAIPLLPAEDALEPRYSPVCHRAGLRRRRQPVSLERRRQRRNERRRPLRRGQLRAELDRR